MFESKEIDLFDLEEDDFDTVLANDIVFSGNIKFSKPFMIRGKVFGSITATGDLVIDAGASVHLDDIGISADRILVRGTVEGNIVAKKLVFVAATGVVKGDITAGQVVLEPGSMFSGRCTMVKEV